MLRSCNDCFVYSSPAWLRYIELIYSDGDHSLFKEVVTDGATLIYSTPLFDSAGVVGVNTRGFEFTNNYNSAC